MSRPGLTEFQSARMFQDLRETWKATSQQYGAEGTSCWTRNRRLLEAEAMFVHLSTSGIRRVQTRHAVNEKPFQPRTLLV